MRQSSVTSDISVLLRSPQVGQEHLQFAACRGERPSSVWEDEETARLMGPVLREELCVTIAAERQGSTIGYAFLLLPGIPVLSAEAVLGMKRIEIPRAIIVVHPNFRHLGAGETLMNRVTTELRQRGFRQVDMEASNTFAGFPEKLGFSRVHNSFRTYRGDRYYLWNRGI